MYLLLPLYAHNLEKYLPHRGEIIWIERKKIKEWVHCIPSIKKFISYITFSIFYFCGSIFIKLLNEDNLQRQILYAQDLNNLFSWTSLNSFCLSIFPHPSSMDIKSTFHFEFNFRFTNFNKPQLESSHFVPKIYLHLGSQFDYWDTLISLLIYTIAASGPNHLYSTLLQLINCLVINYSQANSPFFRRYKVDDITPFLKILQCLLIAYRIKFKLFWLAFNAL